MRSKRLLLYATAMTATGLCGLAVAEPTALYDDRSNGWNLRFVGETDEMGPTSCVAEQLTQERGPSLRLEIRKPLALGLSINSTLPPPTSAALKLSVDGEPMGQHPVSESQLSSWGVRVDESTEALMALRDAREISLNGEQRAVSARLNPGTANSVEKLIDCAELAASFDARRPPGLRRLHPADKPGTPRRRQVYTLLRLSGFGEVDLIPPGRMGLPASSIAWETDTSHGASIVELRALRSLDELSRDQRELFMSDCAGEVKTTTPPVATEPGYTLVQNFFSCQTSQDLTVVTSLLDQVDVLSFVVSGRSDDPGFARNSRRLGTILELLIRP
ncbi:hypothetical protein MK489_20015 [Myxococcota bacterium]|nr:hypothetical protein [Myxococcota bacterium]